MKKLFIIFIISLLPISLFSEVLLDFETPDGKILEGVVFGGEKDFDQNLVKGLSRITKLSEKDCIIIENLAKRITFRECTQLIDKTLQKQINRYCSSHAVFYEPISEDKWQFSIIRHSDTKKYYIKQFTVNINTNYFIMSYIRK